MSNYSGALYHLETSGIRQDKALLEALRYWQDNPLRVVASGVIEIPFTNDKLSPFMPGFSVKINGQEAVARLDTGGGFINLTPAWAERLRVRSTGKEKGFASLQQVEVGYGGLVDLELGSFALQNVPVYVMSHLEAQSKALAEEFGEELGPVIGTNVFQQFLTTVDGPGKRLILSPRRDSVTATAHAALLTGDAEKIPFTMWDDHFMLARGTLNRTPVNLFFDSGLVAANPEQGQVALLASDTSLKNWGMPMPNQGRFAVVPGPLSFGGLISESPTILSVTESTWQAMGDWGGVEVNALISWGFLKNYIWTINFDQMTFTLRRKK